MNSNCSLLFFFAFSISNLRAHTFHLYCSSRPALTVIDRCLQSHSAKSDMRHMGVPPSCHVCLPMSPLWLRWRWQEQSGACQSYRKRLTLSLSLIQLPSLLQEQPTYTLAVDLPLGVSAVINFPDFQWAGELPFPPPTPSQVTLTGGPTLRMPASLPEVSILSTQPVTSQRNESKRKITLLYVCFYTYVKNNKLQHVNMWKLMLQWCLFCICLH